MFFFFIMNLKDLQGLYYVYDYRTRTHGQNYVLNIFPGTNDKTEFTLQTTVSGNFGSSGIIWKGNCRLNDNKLIFEAIEENDWRFTAVQEEKEENVYKIYKSFEVEIVKEDDIILLVMALYERTIKLIKLKKIIDEEKLSSIVYWISHEIIEHYNLRKNNLEFEPSRFWRISNLLLTCFNDVNVDGNDAIEIVCEYDLELVKEEKRVIEDDEILGEHHIDKAIFDKNYKILDYKIIE